MEEHGQGRRYSRTIPNTSQAARYASPSSTAQHDVLADVSADRYRQGQLGLPASSRPLGADTHYYSDQVSTFSSTENMSAAQLSYDSNYDTSSGARQQTAGFGSYNTGMMMYSVPQANTQTSLYNTSPYMPSLSSRNNTIASESLLPAQQDVNQSYFGTDVAAASVATTLEQHASNATTSAYYQSVPLPFHYTGTGVGGGNSGGGTGSLTGVENFYQLADPGDGGAAMPDATEGDKAAEFKEKWLDYQQRLANIFQDITTGNLERAADGLLSISLWLLSRVEELGLTEDDESLHRDRLKLWQDFNHAWIALVFKQKQYMLKELQDASLPQPLSLRTIKRMGDELIRLCDGIERHGLVDYQFGVWEDEIESLLEDCLNLYEAMEKDSQFESSHEG